MSEHWRDDVEAELGSLTREQREAIDAWPVEHDCDEDGEIPCSVCGYRSGMYDEPEQASEKGSLTLASLTFVTRLSHVTQHHLKVASSFK